MTEIRKIIREGYWIPALAAGVMVLLVIPLLLIAYNHQNKGRFAPEVHFNGSYVKSSSRVFYDFLDNIKASNGLLVLGTSETNITLNGNNYWALLNRDSTFSRNISVLAGAGRCSYVYFPAILNNPEHFEELEVLYYVNPTYWRKGLNHYRKDYYTRYVDPTLLPLLKPEGEKLGIYEQFMAQEASRFPNYHNIIDHHIDDFKSYYYHDLDRFFNDRKIIPGATKGSNRLESFYSEEQLLALRNKINPQFNATDDFMDQGHDFPVIDSTSDFQDNMLLAFIKICKQYNIRCTFYLGPFNEIYCRENNPAALAKHQATMVKIKTILENSGLPYIDGSGLSNVPGTFKDMQHISEYGAYLTALQIKEHYEKR